MASRLTELQIRKVSVVPRGANPDAHIVLFKSEEGTPIPTQKETFDTVRSEQDAYERRDAAWSGFLSHMDTLRVAVARTLFSPDEPLSDIATSLDQFRDASMQAIAGVTKEHTMKTKIDRAKLTKEELAYLDELETQMAKAAPAADPAADVLKELPDAVRKMIDDQRAEIEKANDRAARAEATALVEKEARELSVVEKMVTADLGNLPGTSAATAATLRAVQKSVDATVFDSVLTLLKAGNAALHALTKQTGDDTGAEVGTTFEEITKLAKEYVSKGEAKTVEQGIDLVATKRPELWKQYRAENRRVVVAQ